MEAGRGLSEGDNGGGESEGEIRIERVGRQGETGGRDQRENSSRVEEERKRNITREGE